MAVNKAHVRARPESNPVQFIVGGRSLTEAEILASAPKRQQRSSAGVSKSFHKGFRVEGHPPGALESARDAAQSLLSAWEAMGSDGQRAALSEGRRRPKEWDEAAWLKNTKLRPVRHKPYEVPEAAEECRRMAIRAGWLCVAVREVKQGEANTEGAL